jgi:hypothetical protein
MNISFKNYIETYADMGFHLGEYDVLNVFDQIPEDKKFEEVFIHGKKALNIAQNLDKILGMKKMIMLLGPTTNTLISNGVSISKILRHPKKLSGWIELKKNLVELTKLAAINPLIAGPVAIGTAFITGIEEGRETILLLTKLASSIYFYIESIVRIMSNSKLSYVRKLAEPLKDKVAALMPKSKMPH